MVQIKAHFDGRVFVPDEPLDLRGNQRVVITVEAVAEASETLLAAATHQDRVLSMIGWANHADDNLDASLRNVTDDQLWGE